MANNVLDFSAAARSVAADQPDDTVNTDAFSLAAKEVAAQQKTALSAGVAKAATVAPSQFNEAFKLGKTLGMDSDMILRNPVEAKRMDFERRVEGLQNKAPTLANAIGRTPELSPLLMQDEEAMSVIDPMLRDWQRAQTASENVAREQVRQGKGLAAASKTLMGLRAEGEREGQFNLEAMENAPRQESLNYAQAVQQVYGRPVAGLLRGLNDLSFGTGELATSVVNQFTDMPWMESVETFFRENREYGYDLADRIGGSDQQLSFVTQGVVSGLESFGMNIPSLVAGVAGAPLKAVMGMFGLMTTSASGVKGLEEGLTPVQALYYGATDGAIEVITEMAPFLRVMKDIDLKSGFLKTFVNYQISEQPREQLATLAQDFNAFVAIEPDATLSDYLNARPEAAAQTVLAVLAAGGATASAISIAQSAANSLRDQAETSQANAEQLLNLFNAAANSTLLENSPETFEQLLKESIQEGGTAPEVLYIEAPRLRDIVGEEGLANLRESSPLLAEQIDLAMETSDLIELPTETVTRLFAGSGVEQALSESIRTQADMPSAVEAREEAARAAEELQARATEVVGQQMDQESWNASRQEVVDNVFAQLGEARRFTADVNRVYADLVGNYYAATAAQIGTTPAELFNRIALGVGRGNTSANTLSQTNPAGTVTPGARPGQVSVAGRHFSRAQRGFLSGTMYGKGMKGAERQRAMYAEDKRLRTRVYAYVDEGQGVRPESGVGGYRHDVKFDNLYDIGQDPLGLVQQDASAMESAILDAGFDGYYAPASFGNQGAAVLIGPAAERVEVAPPGETFAQSVSLRDGRETLKKYGLDPAKRHKTRDVAAALEARQRKRYGLIADDDRSEEASKKIAGWMAEEVLFEMQHPEKSGVGWYSEKFQRAIDNFAKEFPELATDQTARDTLTALIAITSDGQKVGPNFAQAADIYANFRATGKFKSDRSHQRQDSIEGNLKRIQELYDNIGAEAARDFLLQEDTVSNLRKLAAEQGADFKTAYQAQTKLPLAAVVLGPKLGAFYANLMGASGYLTMDRWWSRTFNRYRGDLVQAPTRQGLDRFKELLGDPALSDDQAIAATVDIAKGYADKNYKNGTEIERAANTIYKAAFEGIKDAPKNATDRTFMLDTVALAQKSLKRRGVDISIADIQAVLWYYEKRLYGELGAVQSADISYEEAANRVVEARMGVAGGSATQRAEAGSSVSLIEPVPPGLEEYNSGVDQGEVFNQTRDRTGRVAGGSQAPLPGAPTVQGATGPDARLVQVAENYAAQKGIDLVRQGEYVEVDVERATRIAQAYDQMQDDPQNPAVREAYENLIAQTKEQYQALVDAGYSFTFFDSTSDPYDGNPWNAMRDLRQNQTMAVFGTYDGYGSEGVSQEAIDMNPMLQNTGLQWPDQQGQLRPVTANDLFRAVHDAFGHGLEGAGFRDRGEENAWQAHVRMFTGSAVAAITTETRGQNSWLNFGPFGEQNRNAKVEDTVFAPQKVGLMPEWTWTEGRASDFVGIDIGARPEVFNQTATLPPTIATNGVQKPTTNSEGQPIAQTEEGVRNFYEWFGDSKAVEMVSGSSSRNAAFAPLRVFHTTRNAGFTEFEVGRPATNSTTFGDVETSRAALFFTASVGDSNAYAEGSGSATMPVYLRAENVLDVTEGLTESDEARLIEAGFSPSFLYNRFGKWDMFDGETGAQNVSLISSAGYDAVVFNDQNPETGDTFEAWAVFNPNQIKSATGNRGTFDPADPNILNQEARGTFNPTTFNIDLLEKANLSTFVHELGHFFFEMHATLAAENASPEIVQDVQQLLSQVGFEGTVAEWLQQPVEVRRKAHETIAESFEQYLLEGKAPTTELQPLFRKLKNWMKSVYQSLQEFLNLNDNAQLTEEVRGVFDRMLATQQDIEQTAAQRNYMQLFNSAQQAGMTQEEWLDYQSLATEQMELAMETHGARAMRDMKWLDNAKSRLLKELQAEARDRRKTMRAEIAAEIRLQPAYRAMRYFKRGELLDANGAAVTTGNNSNKLNLDALREMYKDNSVVDINALGFGKYGMVAKEGSHPDVLAPLFGFSSGDALVRAVSTAPNMNQLIEDVTDQRMLERYGDLATEQDVMDSVNEALANEAHMKMVATELASGNKAVGRVSALRKAAKQLGREVLNRRKVRALRPDIARSSAAKERKVAERALAKGDKQAFATAKRNELLHLELEMQQRKLRASMEKDMRAFARMFKGKNDDVAKRRDMDLVNLARAILANYELSPEVGGQRAQNYQALVAQYDGPLAMQLQVLASGLPESKDYRELTVEEYTAVRDRVSGLWDLSRRQKQVMIDGQLMDIELVTEGLVQEVLDVNEGELKPLPGYGTAQTKAEKTKGYLLGAAAHLVRVDSFAGILGPNFQRMVAQVKEAATAYRKEKGNVMEVFSGLVTNHRSRLTWDRIAAPELSSTWAFNDKAQLLHAIMHTGNDSNMRKLLLGQGFSSPSEAWGSVREDGTLDTTKWDRFMSRMFAEGTITKEDMDFVQSVWDLLESIKEPAQRAHKDMFGYYFNEITARPIQTPFGEYRGGYVPAVANDPGVQQKKAQEQMLQTQGAAMFPSTGSGFTEQRVEFNRALELDLTLLASHIDSVVKFTYLEPAIRDVGKLINNRSVSRALNGAYPNAINGILMPWLRASASQSVTLPFDNPLLNRLMNGLRNRAGTTLMFLNFVNTVEQLTGFSIAAYKIPKGAMVSSLARYVRQPSEMKEGIFALSPWMEDRVTTKSFMLQQQLERVILNPNALQKADQFFQRYGYITQQMLQNFMDIVVWDAAYNQAVKNKRNERDAARYADEIVRTTQSSFAPEDVASVEVANPFMRLFLQFVGWFNMVGNFVGQEAVLAKRELGWSTALGARVSYLFILAISIPAMVSATLRGMPTEDDDEDMDGMLDEYMAWFFGTNFRMVTAMVPGVGQAATAGLNAFNDLPYDDRISMSPGVSIAESAIVGIPGAVQKTIEGEEWGKREIRAILTSFSLLTGIPTGFLSRAIGFTIDVEEGRKEAEDNVDVAVGLLTGR